MRDGQKTKAQLVAELDAMRQRVAVLEAQVSSHEEVETALQAIQERNRQLFDNANDGVYIVSRDGRITAANKKFAEMVGMPLEEIIGQKTEIFLPDGFEQSLARIERTIREGTLGPYDLDFTTRFGKKIISMNAVAYYENDVPVGMLVTAREVTERRRLEEKLHHARGELERQVQDRTAELVQTNVDLLRSATRLTILHEIDRAILAAASVQETAEAALRLIPQLIPCQQASVMLFDYVREEGVILAFQNDRETQLGAGARFPFSACGIEELQQGKPYGIEDILAISSPSAVFHALQAEGMRSSLTVPLIAPGELIGSLSLAAETPRSFRQEDVEVIREIADQLAIAIYQARLDEQLQQQAAEIHRNAQWWQSLIDTTQDAVIAIDQHACIVLFNPAAERIFGYRQAEVQGQKVNMLMAEPYASEHDSYLERYERTHEPTLLVASGPSPHDAKMGKYFPSNYR